MKALAVVWILTYPITEWATAIRVYSTHDICQKRAEEYNENVEPPWWKYHNTCQGKCDLQDMQAHCNEFTVED